MNMFFCVYLTIRDNYRNCFIVFVSDHKLSAIEIFFVNGIKDLIVTYLFQIVINIVYFMFQQLFWQP